LAARQPLLVVFEDIHWSDPTTRELLDLIIDLAPKLKVPVTITFRPEFTPPSDPGVARAGQPFLPAFPPALVGRASEARITR